MKKFKNRNQPQMKYKDRNARIRKDMILPMTHIFFT